ncbi:hypothetical protein V6N11_054643 [Hibiscus sabdariffa]|uniref:Uncharacterized protein n=1 Tax=Hibiscus sabdariffa TaxID=183260 RepID=A0ABR2S538_9ROSI
MEWTTLQHLDLHREDQLDMDMIRERYPHSIKVNIGPKCREFGGLDHGSISLHANQRYAWKGANFIDLPGVLVKANNKVEWDPNVEKVYLESGKPLVPDYAMTFFGGTSCNHLLVYGGMKLYQQWSLGQNLIARRYYILNKILSSRFVRMQGYKASLITTSFSAPLSKANAVAVPVCRALGYALGLAYRVFVSSDEPLMKLPSRFPNLVEKTSSGLMGSGKTTVGKILSHILSYSFYDRFIL